MGCSRCGKGRKAAKRVSAAGGAARAAEIRRAAADAGVAAKAAELRKRGVRPTAPAPMRSQARPNARAVPYTIVRGDTMADIGRRFGMTTQEIAKYDGGTGVPNLARIRSRNIHVLSPGEVILVPRKGR